MGRRVVAGGSELDRRAALDAAVGAAEAATRVLLRRFRPPSQEPLTARMKGAGALVTDADIASDEAIASALEEAGAPGDFVSEESAAEHGGGDLTWLIDPLCGTTPYSTGMGHWGLNIALRAGSMLEVGVLALPTLGELFTAVRGKGAARSGRPLQPEHPLGRLQDVAVALEIDSGPVWARLAAPSAPDRSDAGRRSPLEWTAHVGQINSFASAAYPVGQVLLGRLHAVVFYTIGAVHLAAGAAIAAEVGVAVTDGRGEPLDWASDHDFELVVIGWPEVHAELLEAMGE